MPFHIVILTQSRSFSIVYEILRLRRGEKCILGKNSAIFRMTEKPFQFSVSGLNSRGSTEKAGGDGGGTKCGNVRVKRLKLCSFTPGHMSASLKTPHVFQGCASQQRESQSVLRLNLNRKKKMFVFLKKKKRGVGGERGNWSSK